MREKTQADPWDFATPEHGARMLVKVWGDSAELMAASAAQSCRKLGQQGGYEFWRAVLRVLRGSNAAA